MMKMILIILNYPNHTHLFCYDTNTGASLNILIVFSRYLIKNGTARVFHSKVTLNTRIQRSLGPYNVKI